jgi:hypothetical protein
MYWASGAVTNGTATMTITNTRPMDLHPSSPPSVRRIGVWTSSASSVIATATIPCVKALIRTRP